MVVDKGSFLDGQGQIEAVEFLWLPVPQLFPVAVGLGHVPEDAVGDEGGADVGPLFYFRDHVRAVGNFAGVAVAVPAYQVALVGQNDLVPGDGVGQVVDYFKVALPVRGLPFRGSWGGEVVKGQVDNQHGG